MIVTVDFHDNDFSVIFESFFANFYDNMSNHKNMRFENAKAYKEKHGKYPEDYLGSALDNAIKILEGEKSNDVRDDLYIVFSQDSILKEMDDLISFKELLMSKSFKEYSNDELVFIKDFIYTKLCQYIRNSNKINESTKDYLIKDLEVSLGIEFIDDWKNGEVICYFVNHKLFIRK